MAAIDLYWLPLGAGGWFVRLNGRLYETIKAFGERRRRFDLYHSALVVAVPEGEYVIESAWPIPDDHPSSRGVAMQGPVGSRSFSSLRVCRYEVRRWKDGVIPDIAEAVASPQRLSRDADQAHRVLDLVPSVPSLVWGRDELGIGEMWNSNSVVSWLLVSGAVPLDGVRFPMGGRAPGWDSGIAIARRLPTEHLTDSMSQSRGSRVS